MEKRENTVKKVLIVASVISFIEWFNKENILYLKQQLCCDVHIAVNTDYMEDTDIPRTRKYLKDIDSLGIKVHNIPFARSPLSFANIKAYMALKELINNTDFDLIHCHTPVAAMLTRLCARRARRKGTTVMYTCHGFHFHHSSPKKNWFIYYPVERILSKFCDYIVTINKEDFAMAKTFYAPQVRYIPGVGVDIDKIKSVSIDKKEYKKSLGIPEDSILILSIGEIIARKNHEIIIRAIANCDNQNIYYAIAGRGPLREYLQKLAKELGIEDKVQFLGFRQDIPELCNAADISAFPSRIEGLGLAGIEAMAAGVPLVASNVQGILDYVIDGETGYALAPDDLAGFTQAICTLANNRELRTQMREKCIAAVEPFSINNALKEMWNIYKEIL